MSRGRKRERHDSWGKLVLGLLLIFISPTVVLAFFLTSFWLEESLEGPPKAVIVDHLSLTYPNPNFVQNAAATLQQAGYEVDYYPGEVVTVNFYRNLSSYDYGLIILRVHSARHQGIWGSTPVDTIGLFTSEPYSETKYLREQSLKQLSIAAYYEDGEQYFGIEPGFITQSMQGEFDDTIVIMMGCKGLITEATAEAFIRKGAKTVISWSDSVTAHHTDIATEQLLQYLLIEKLAIKEAVEKTMSKVGPDPAYGSRLLFYPP